jgi:diadenosine tetraphosphatase ApaH/serine/threonine PP2A family protein phosphatase
VIDRLRALGDRAHYVMGNGDRELVEAFDAGASPQDAGDLFARAMRWAAARLSREQRDLLAGYVPTVRAEIDRLGPALFCHGSPRSDTEAITVLTPEARLAPMLEGVVEPLIVCGHTHRQFDRTVAGRRIVNAGSVGMPYEGIAAAFWALFGPGVELRRTAYDVEAAAAAMRATGAPSIDEAMLRDSLLEPADPDEVARFFERGG